MKYLLGFILLIAGMLLIFVVLYKNSGFEKETSIFSPYSLLNASWEGYKKLFITPEGRVVDDREQDRTTSEAQSYALLRAVWLDDKPTFDSVWNWTQNNMKRPDGTLFGWQWGKKPDQSYGLLEPSGINTASDADSDIALALILAGRRWRDDGYRNTARDLLADIWDTEVASAAGVAYLAAGNWAKNENSIIVNPSYWTPSAWRVFGQEDASHPWESLIEPAYAMLHKAGSDNLDQERSVGLPPNWLEVDVQTGAIRAPTDTNLTTDYSYDAMRTPWRIALDWEWNQEPRAKTYLFSLSYLSQAYTTSDTLAPSYRHDGTPVGSYEDPVMYATALGTFIVTDPNLASRLYTEKIIRLYSNDSDSFMTTLPYYAQNWLWFAAALYHHALPDYAP